MSLSVNFFFQFQNASSNSLTGMETEAMKIKKNTYKFHMLRARVMGTQGDSSEFHDYVSQRLN